MSDKSNEIKFMGVVGNCSQLRIREKPNKEAKEIAIIPAGTLVDICDEESINGFYSIIARFDDGKSVSGYSMKDFISIIHPDEE